MGRQQEFRDFFWPVVGSSFQIHDVVALRSGRYAVGSGAAVRLVAACADGPVCPRSVGRVRPIGGKSGRGMQLVEPVAIQLRPDLVFVGGFHFKSSVVDGIERTDDR